MVSIIVLNWNNWRDTIECLESLIRLDGGNYNIIVVDNGSTDNSPIYIEQWLKGEYVFHPNEIHADIFKNSPELEKSNYLILNEDNRPEYKNANIAFLKLKTNKGYAAGNNAGIKYALLNSACGFFWILNNDTIVERLALRLLIEKAEYYKASKDKAGLIGSKLKYYYDPSLLQAIGAKYNKFFAIGSHIGGFVKDTGQYDNEAARGLMDYPIGASLFACRDFIEDVGLLNEEYFLYFEEIDWILRGKAKGWNFGYDWKGKIFHKEGASAEAGNLKKNEKGILADLYSIINRIKITSNYFRFYLPSVYIGILLAAINRLRRRQIDRFYLLLLAFFNKEKVIAALNEKYKK